MRKNLNKIIAFAIGISVISGSVVPVMAADKTSNVVSINSITKSKLANNKVLTLEEAIKTAISNSETLKVYDKKISYQNQINSANEKIDDAKDTDDDTKDYNKDSRDIELKLLKKERDEKEDSLRKSVTDAYNNLVSSQMKIDNLEKNMEITNKQFNDIKLKEQLGLVTSLNTQETDIGAQTLANSITYLKNNLTNSKESFKRLTGIDPTNYVLNEDIDYDIFRIDESVDEYIDNIIDSYLSYNEEKIKINKDYINDNKVSDPGKFNKEAPKKSDYTDDPVDQVDGKNQEEKYKDALKNYQDELDIYVAKVKGRITYLQSKLSIYEGEVQLNESKKNLKDALRNYYSMLLNNEKEIEVLKQKVDLCNKKARNAKLNFDLGLSTKTDYEKALLECSDLNLQLRNSIQTYNQTKEKIQKPWLLSQQ